jgi:WhiB family redox-sensing transcriptional regulator
MTAAVSTDRASSVIPAEALAEWLNLAAVVDEIGAVPCRTSDPEAWWPDKGDVDGFAARMALDACSVCAARPACLSYALAADESEGIWAGTLPEERREMRQEAA